MGGISEARARDAPPLIPAHQRKNIGPYRIEEVLGIGGMGVVCRAVGPDGAAVAVKMLQTVLIDERSVRRFQQEAKLRIEHPNVVRVLDAGADADGTPYIAFELLDGETLERRLGGGLLRVEEVRRLGVDICRGLQAAHDAGIVHRDLKPANLFICSDGVIKVLDFGIALASPGTRLTVEGTVLGTASYLSPEQARGSLDLDARTDVWALGAVLYEMLVGRAPFARPTSLATMLAVLMDPLAPLSTVRSDLPADVARAIERALSKEPADRWSSARAFEDALTGAADARGASSPAVAADAMPADEERIVSVLLADRVVAPWSIELAIVDHGGVPIQLLGGRMIGLFGGDLLAGDEAIRAVQAALRSRDAAAYMSVASGRATRSGSALSGAAISAAEQGCAAGLDGVAVDAATAHAVTTMFEVEPSAAEIKQVRSGSAVTAATDVGPPMLGREGELEQIELLARGVAQRRRARAVLVIGPPGIGKTRLRLEAERAIRRAEPGASIRVARGQVHRRNVSLAVLAALLDSVVEPLSNGTELLVTIEGRRPAPPSPTPTTAPPPSGVGAWLVGLARGVTDTLLVPSGPADAQLAADRLRITLHQHFDALCARGLVVLVVEDAHFADDATLDFLEELMARSSHTPLLLVVTARPELVETRPTVLSAAAPVRIDLSGLGASEVHELARARAARELPRSFTDAITARTGGNPLFVEEIVAAGVATASDDPAALPLPLTVEAAIQSRLDHLSPAEKEACKRASVLCRAFTLEELGALGEPDPASVVSALVRRDLLLSRRSRGGALDRFVFRSALVSEVAYRMLGADFKAELHLRAARHLASRRATDAAEVAVHWDEGGERDLAAEAYVRATAEASQRGDAAGVLRCSDRAIALGASDDARARLHLARADAFRFLGRREAWGRELDLAADGARTDADRARARTEHAVWAWRTGSAAVAIEEANAALELARGASASAEVLWALVWRAPILLHLGRRDEARVALDEASRITEGRTGSIAGLIAEWGAQIAASEGRVGDQLASLLEAVQHYGEARDVRRAAGAECNLADGYNRLGRYPDAERALRAALEGCRRVSNRVMEGYALVNLAYALASMGRADEALLELEEAREVATTTEDTRLALAVRLYRGRALLRRGGGDGTDVAALATELEAVAADADAAALRPWSASALALAARAHLAAGDIVRALSTSERSLAIRDELGSLEEDEADVFLTRAEVLEGAGRADEAAAVRSRGKRRVLELAQGVLDAASREQFLALPQHARLVA